MSEAAKQDTETRIETDSMGEIEVAVERLLGRADAALAEAFQHRVRCNAARDDTRARDTQKGGGDRQRRPRQASRGQDGPDRPGGRRGDRRQARRPFPAARLADRLGHADQHERQRGHLEPRHRDRGRRDGFENAGPPERRRKQIAVVERHVPDRDVYRGGRAAQCADPRGREGGATRSRQRRKNSRAW